MSRKSTSKVTDAKEETTVVVTEITPAEEVTEISERTRLEIEEGRKALVAAQAAIAAAQANQE